MFNDPITLRAEVDYRREQLQGTVVRRPDRDRRSRWTRRAARRSEALR